MRCWLREGCALGFLVVAVGPQAAAEPVTWSTGPGANGHQYELHVAEGISWSAARDAAAALGDGWHLVTITSQAEQDWVNETMFRPQGQGGGYWLGGLQVPDDEPDASRGWTWVTGETWGYENWVEGEPNDYWGPSSEQHLALDTGGDVLGWYDESRVLNIWGFLSERSLGVLPEVLDGVRDPTPAGRPGDN